MLPRVGALLLHHYTGDPSSLAGLAAALAGSGVVTSSPWLAGHGAGEEALITTRWPDFLTGADGELTLLRPRCDRVVVIGLSLGGGLALALAGRHPGIAGVIAINPVVEAPARMDALRRLARIGVDVLPEARPVVEDPDVVLPEAITPVEGLLSVADGVAGEDWGRVRCPVLLITSRRDTVVDPASADRLADRLGGPVERLHLDRGGHLATVDLDRERVTAGVVGFVRGLVRG